jgi:integrase/recombinase XerD
LSIRTIRAHSGEVISFEVFAGKVKGQKIRRSFSVKRWGGEAKAMTMARYWLKRQREEILRDRDNPLLLHRGNREEAAEALKLLEPYNVRLLDAVRQWVQDRAAPPIQPWTFGQATDAFLAAKRDQNVRPDYLRTVRGSLSLARQVFGAKLLSDITTDEIEDWLRTRGKNGNGLSPTTWRNYRRDLSMLFRFAIDRERASRDPARRLPRPRDPDAPVAILRVCAVTRLLKVLDPRATLFVSLGLFAGLRPFEAARLPYPSLKQALQTGFLEISGPHSKSRRRRMVTVTQCLRAWIEAYGHHCDRTRSYRQLLKYVHQARDKAGVTLSQDIFRHTFASHHLALHQNAALTAQELGHHNQNTLYAHYREIVSRGEAEAFFSLIPENVHHDPSDQTPS